MGVRELWYDHLDRVPFEFEQQLASDNTAWLYKDFDDDVTTSSPFVIFGAIEENASGDGFVVYVRVKPDLPVGVHTDTLIVWGKWKIIDKLPLVFTVRAAEPLPSLARSIIIPRVIGGVTNPPVGIHYVASGHDFIFTFTPTDTSLFYDAPIVRTGRTGRAGEDDVVVTPNDDGSYTIRVLAVRQALTLTVEPPPPVVDTPPDSEPALPMSEL
jgi:hypothetical protein